MAPAASAFAPRAVTDLSDDITESIDGLTLRVRAYRIARYIEKGHQMSVMQEKLKQAGGVALRQTQATIEDADKLIAREADYIKRRKAAFGAHHSVMDENFKGMDALDRDLALISNDPLGDSADLLPTVTTGQIDQGRPHSEVLSDNLDNGKLSLNNPRRPV